MVDDMNQKRVIKGHGEKGRQHMAKIKALEGPIVVANARWPNLP
jgi:hypothetical protein